MTQSRPFHALVVPATLLTIIAAANLPVPPAHAHHGWAWAMAEQSTLEGTVAEVSMAPPHPSLKVKDAAGTVWLIDLANPAQTERSGFTAQSAKPGDTIVIIGNRNRDETQKHMKAVRITVAGKTYDIYPGRIRTN